MSQDSIMDTQGKQVTPKQTLGRRLLVAMLPWYLLLALSVTVVQLAVQSVFVNQTIGRDLVSLGRTTEPGAVEAVWELDAARLAAVAHGVRQNAIVTGVRIVSDKDASLVAEGDLPGLTPQQHGLLSGPHQQHTVDLMHTSASGVPTLIGRLHLYSNLSVLWAQLKPSFLLVLVNSLLVTTGLWLIFSWTIRHRLSAVCRNWRPPWLRGPPEKA